MNAATAVAVIGAGASGTLTAIHLTAAAGQARGAQISCSSTASPSAAAWPTARPIFGIA